MVAYETLRTIYFGQYPGQDAVKEAVKDGLAERFPEGYALTDAGHERMDELAPSTEED